MRTTEEQWRPDFEVAMGESFSDSVSPPVPFEYASTQECCEVVWLVAGRDVTPTRLANLPAEELSQLALRFGTYFECEPPTDEQIKTAVSRTLARWPVGSLGESELIHE